MNEEATAVKLLQEGLSVLGVDEGYQPALWQYLGLLKKWNQAYNLTAIRDLPAMVTRHVLDSLAIRPYLQGQRIVDVGTGAGLPGLLLALVEPTREFMLLDSNGKKTRFLNEVKRSLQIANVTVVQTRVESYHPDCCFDTVVSRAFSELKQMIRWTEHLLAPEGIWLAMKGLVPEKELRQFADWPYQVQEYRVPHLDDHRCVVMLRRG